MTGWLGVRDGQGDAVPFSAKALDQVLKDWPELVAPLFQGFWRAHQQVREKTPRGRTVLGNGRSARGDRIRPR
ncbi:hypothetical protein WJ969_13665 [Achromobacter xylosoxidans]